MIPAALCGLAINLALGGLQVGATRAAVMQDACVEVVVKADAEQMDRHVAIAIAWFESRFTPTAVSSEGAVGTMQVIPRWACPNRRKQGCDLVAAGVHAYLAWLRRYKEPRLALCHYNSGNVCTGSSRAYARRVLDLAERLAAAAGDERCQSVVTSGTRIAR
jgi:soluble lytic murein transglycosylase-like protein